MTEHEQHIPPEPTHPTENSFLDTIEWEPDDPGWLAWQTFKHWTGSRDVNRFRELYRGHWPNRAAFGLHLADQFGADRRLAAIPSWMRRYIQLDGDQIAADFVAAGHYFIHDLPEDAGCVVFDADA